MLYYQQILIFLNLLTSTDNLFVIFSLDLSIFEQVYVSRETKCAGTFILISIGSIWKSDPIPYLLSKLRSAWSRLCPWVSCNKASQILLVQRRTRISNSGLILQKLHVRKNVNHPACAISLRSLYKFSLTFCLADSGVHVPLGDSRHLLGFFWKF